MLITTAWATRSFYVAVAVLHEHLIVASLHSRQSCVKNTGKSETNFTMTIKPLETSLQTTRRDIGRKNSQWLKWSETSRCSCESTADLFVVDTNIIKTASKRKNNLNELVFLTTIIEGKAVVFIFLLR